MPDLETTPPAPSNGLDPLDGIAETLDRATLANLLQVACFDTGFHHAMPAVASRMALDAAANARNAPVISAPGSAITVRVIPTDEERMIALHTWNVLREADRAALLTR